MILIGEAKTLILIADDVIRRIRCFTIPPEARTEAGGILIGCYRGPHLEITDCTVPLARDVRRRFLFDRKDSGHGVAAMCAWHRSRRTLTYVGEWHTHPEDYPSPSSIDTATWRNIQKRHSDDHVLFVIVGRLGFWSALGNGGALLPLTILDD